jgi:uncharacterized caspase-like protein
MNSSGRRRVIQAAGGSLLLPFWPGLALGQASRTLSVERRPPAEQARAEANLNAAPRHALVIGNSRYTAVTPLRNPANDATAMAAQLKGSGFQVQLRQDLDREGMIDAIEAYSARLAANKSVGLFFFAGHGLQLSWRNYLVPVDAKLGGAEEIPQRCVDLSSLIGGISKANNPMNVVVLDACRDNPFREVKVEGRGLSPFDAPPGTLLAYATSPGNVASDGEGTNGLYTEHLLRELKVPEAKIEDVFKRVRLGVRRGSNGRQIPWESTSLEEDFYFLPPKQFQAIAQSEANRRFEAELAAWEKVKGSKEAALLEDFMRRYPSGRFSELAQLHLDRVLAAQGEQRIKIESIGPTPFSQGIAVADTGYKVGDTYTYQVSDLFTKIRGQSVTDTVGRVTEDQVHMTNGGIRDHLSNPIRARDGRQFTAMQLYPTEYRVGKRWSLRTRFINQNGQPGMLEQGFLASAREKITVPAGTFDAFRIDARGFFTVPVGSGDVEMTYWVDPSRVRTHIAMEDRRRFGTNYYVASERYELESFKQS